MYFVEYVVLGMEYGVSLKRSIKYGVCPNKEYIFQNKQYLPTKNRYAKRSISIKRSKYILILTKYTRVCMCLFYSVFTYKYKIAKMKNLPRYYIFKQL